MITHSDSLSVRDMNRLCRLIYEHCGIALNAEKKVMLEGRLRRRMASLQVASFGDYCNFLFSGDRHDESELVQLIDAVTTNKTDFFREKAHFDFLTAVALPELVRHKSDGRGVRIWSAGCSTGEEPYTLAMVLSEYRGSHPGFGFQLVATDISTSVLAKANKGVYPAEVARPVPPDLRRKYFMRSRDTEAQLLRVVPELRAAVEFRRLNLMDDFALAEPLDAIFCRNVIIYFDRPTQERLFQRMIRQLVDGGYIFVGHSESLHHFDIPLAPVAPAIYRKIHGRN